MPDVFSFDLVQGRLVEIVSGVFAGRDPAAAVAEYRRSRPGASPGRILSAITTDSTFRIPAIRLAEAQAAAGGRAWMYLFGWPTPVFDGRLGSCHALEIPFVFDNLDKPGADVFVGQDAPAPLAKAMIATWCGFARDGEPGGGPLGPWPAYEPATRSTMVLEPEARLEDDPMGAERALWEGIR